MFKPLPLIVVLWCGLGMAGAVQPQWWTAENTRILSLTAPSNNFGSVNLGQLKHVAQQAKEHLDAYLPSGAGPDIDEMVGAFQSDPSSNYSPVNLGQLKAVAKPFYDRLREAGFDTRANLIAHGYPANWPEVYPWNSATPVEENYATANLGQLKMVFSFDLTSLTNEFWVPAPSNLHMQ